MFFLLLLLATLASTGEVRTNRKMEIKDEAATRYGAGGTKYGAGRTKYGAGGTKYGTGGTKYGAGGMKYGTGGMKYGTLQSKDGKRYGAGQTKFGTLKSKDGSGYGTLQPAEGTNYGVLQPVGGKTYGILQPADGINYGSWKSVNGTDYEAVQPANGTWDVGAGLDRTVVTKQKVGKERLIKSSEFYSGPGMVFQNSIMAIQIHPDNTSWQRGGGATEYTQIARKGKKSRARFPRGKNYDNVFLRGENGWKESHHHKDVEGKHFEDEKSINKQVLKNSQTYRDTKKKEFKDSAKHEFREMKNFVFNGSDNPDPRRDNKNYDSIDSDMKPEMADDGGSEIYRRVFREVEQLKPPPTPESIFLSKNNTNVGTHVGATVTLNCRIARNSDYEAISWFRLPGPRSTLTLLTVGDDTIIADSRINIVRPILSMNWCLHISSVKKEDEGKYKCQSTTYPPTSIIVNLKVMAAYSEIAGTKEKIVRTGSELHLVCLIHDITTTPSFIFWYQDDRMINYDTAAGVSVSLTEHPRNRLKSILRVKNVGPNHSGNYSCSPDNAVPDSVVVRVVKNSPQHQEGMQPAPVQDINSASAHTKALKAALIIMLIHLL